MNKSVVEKYSELARRYDDQSNLESCWGQAAGHALEHIVIRPSDQMIVDVGCGTGQALVSLADRLPETAQFVGVEPAGGMRERAEAMTRGKGNIRIRDGRFERLPLQSESVDYLFSLFAFHWTTDLDRSVRELARVLKHTGSMDLFFIGRNNGREFIRATSSVFLKYLGPHGLLESAKMRKQLTRDQAHSLFVGAFGQSRVQVSEDTRTYYDTLDGHWGWWVRIEGQFVNIPPEKRTQCDHDVLNALAALQTDRGIPYTLHELHVRVGVG